jgi:protein-S-isoprenylcysteine O-methyltransferase Ste14
MIARPMVLGFFGVIACWAAFAAVFLSRGKPKGGGAEKSEKSVSRWGVALQSLAYSLAWATPRKYFTPLLSDSLIVTWIEAVAAVALAAFSVWLCWRALETLGKNWAVVARVTEGHQLVRSGPYAVVRNPIYTGMLGMLIATGIVNSRWWGLVAAFVVFHVGTTMRVQSEERLLAEQFGNEFEEYRKQVPAYLPGVRV